MSVVTISDNLLNLFGVKSGEPKKTSFIKRKCSHCATFQCTKLPDFKPEIDEIFQVFAEASQRMSNLNSEPSFQEQVWHLLNEKPREMISFMLRGCQLPQK